MHGRTAVVDQPWDVHAHKDLVPVLLQQRDTQRGMEGEGREKRRRRERSQHSVNL